MNRADELGLKLVDNELSALQGDELSGLLAQDPEGLRNHVRLLEIEACLRGRKQTLDLAQAVHSRLQSQHAEMLVDRVMAEIKASASPSGHASGSVGQRTSQTRQPALMLELLKKGADQVMAAVFRYWRVPAALGVAFLFLAGVAVWCLGPTMGAPALAEVQGGDVSVERGTELMPAIGNMALAPGDVLKIGSNSSAALAFGTEPTRIALTAGTELKVTSLASGKRLELRAGKLEAIVARQRPLHPMIISSPQAQARVLGTKLTLTVTTNSTRLDVEEGAVRLTRVSDQEHVNVPAAHYAVVAPNVDLSVLPKTGWIGREYWINRPGRFVQNLDFSALPDPPSGFEWSSRLETTVGWGEDYAARWRGYLHPPVTGRYEIGLSASHEAQLYFSRDDQPEHVAASMIVQWHQNPTLQRTQNVKLFEFVAGRRYYLEVFHKAGKGPNHLAVSWKPPGAKLEVIGGEYLSPLKPKPKEEAQ